MLHKLAEPAVLAALIAGVVAFVGHFWNPFSARKLERQKAEYAKDLAELNSKIHDLSAERNARRDYEYEARKRLYAQIEPLLFQLYEAVEGAYTAVQSLARTSRSGNLGDGEENWLQQGGYYLRAMTYRLLLPVAYLRVIQRRMTFFDLDVDASISARYQILKQYAWSFTDDFEFAGLPEKLEYDPNHPDWPTRRVAQPAIYARQGIVVGDLDNAVESMLVREADQLRPMTFGEFEAAAQSGGRVEDSLSEPLKLYESFSPSERPVLARMLRVQGCIARILLDSYSTAPNTDPRDLLKSFLDSSDFKDRFSWSAEALSGAKEGAAVQAYLAPRLLRAVHTKRGQSVP